MYEATGRPPGIAPTMDNGARKSDASMVGAIPGGRPVLGRNCGNITYFISTLFLLRGTIPLDDNQKSERKSGSICLVKKKLMHYFQQQNNSKYRKCWHNNSKSHNLSII